MSSLLYSGVISKVKAMSKDLLSIDDFSKISELKTVSEFVNYLKIHEGYKEFFTNCNENTIHRSEVEQILRGAIYKDFSKIYKYSTSVNRYVFKPFIIKAEIAVLKHCLLRILSINTEFDIPDYKDFFVTHSSFDIEVLMNCKTINELTNNLEGTRYHKIFQKFSSGGGYKTLFDYEMDLDIFYFKEIWSLKNKYMTGSSKRGYSKYLGKEIDLLNIISIYRSKKYYQVDNNTILSVIIPINYRISKDELHELIDASSIEEFLSKVQNTKYKKDLEILDSQKSLDRLTRAIIEKTIKSNSDYDFMPIMKYLYLKEKEIDRLTTALECIRYGLPSKEIFEYIV